MNSFETRRLINLIENHGSSDTNTLIQAAAEAAGDVVGFMRSTFTNDVPGALEAIAEQLTLSPAEAAMTRKTFGDRICDIAIQYGAIQS